MTRATSHDHEATWAPTTPLPSLADPAADSRCGPSNATTNSSFLARCVISGLFAVVAVLLIADLHSSLAATQDQWEINPLIDVIAEHVGARAALLCAKAIDFALLTGLYALWRRSKSDVAIALVLVIAAIEYGQIVANNYHG